MSTDKQPIQDIREQVTQQIAWFNRQRRQNKTKAFWVYMAIAAINATVTVLLGLQGMTTAQMMWCRNAALALSSGVTVLAAYEAFYGHRGLWVQYTQTVTRLYGLQARLDYRLSGPDALTDKETGQFFDDLQSILTDTNASWKNQRDEANKSLPKS